MRIERADLVRLTDQHLGPKRVQYLVGHSSIRNGTVAGPGGGRGGEAIPATPPACGPAGQRSTKVTLSVTRYSTILPFSTTTLWLATQASLMFSRV
jgi:hypothetical protein